MELTNEEQKICDDAMAYVKAHKRELVVRITNPDENPSHEKPTVFFMAGSPGAGKTEFSKRLLDGFGGQKLQGVVRVDPDEMRTWMPGYGGGNAHLFQKPVSRLVDEVFSALINNKQDFLLDGTLSNFAKAKQNIERVHKRGYGVIVIYVYQEPLSAWKFTQAREKDEGRRILKETFIRQYFSAKETVNGLKKEFGDTISLWLVVKDALHNIKQFERDIENIDSYLKIQYNQKTLEEVLK